jgi:hypothetical protein
MYSVLIIIGGAGAKLRFNQNLRMDPTMELIIGL